jgi:hypothetical protein
LGRNDAHGGAPGTSRDIASVYTNQDEFYFTLMPPIMSSRRRSHLTRTATAKGVKITDRDIFDIFEPLSRHAQLTTRQLVAFGSRYPTITKARLGELWHVTGAERSHYLHRLNEDVRFANHLFIEDLHRLGVEGEKLLSAKGVISIEPWVSASRIGGGSPSPSRVIRLAHDHMASDIALDIEIGARRAGLVYRSHLDILKTASPAARSAKRPLQIPVTLNGERTSIEPDAIFTIGDRNYALETDKGTESVRAVIVPKILAYREIVAGCIIDEWLGLDNLTVLFATPSDVRKRNIMTELEAIARHGRSPMFGFFADPTFALFMQAAPPSGRYATMPWERVGFDDLRLIA